MERLLTALLRAKMKAEAERYEALLRKRDEEFKRWREEEEAALRRFEEVLIVTLFDLSRFHSSWYISTGTSYALY